MERFDDIMGDERATPEEAREVIELWGRLQQEKEAYAQMPSVRELAETLNTSEDEVSSDAGVGSGEEPAAGRAEAGIGADAG